VETFVSAASSAVRAEDANTATANKATKAKEVRSMVINLILGEGAMNHQIIVPRRWMLVRQ
jgi:hypothetical protein